jgi:ethanolamine utilization protein EutQ (cupin superfamily)
MEAGKALVEAGAEGFDVAGDSIWLPSKGKVTFKVTAKKGAKLAFVCAVHPWMLAEITVK